MPQSKPYIQQPAQADGSGQMFDRIAARYDLLNRLMSFGLDIWWRRQLVRRLPRQAGAHILDVATGTADLALAIAKAHTSANITGVDPSDAMRAIGTKKIRKHALEKRIQLHFGDAQALPFADASFDAATISFGIRNVPDRLQGLREMRRVVKPGGQILVLELAEPKQGILGPLVRWYIHKFVPTLGAFLSGVQEYRYLQRSIAAFPAPEAFVQLCHQADLKHVQYTRLSFGAVSLFSAQTPL